MRKCHEIKSGKCKDCAYYNSKNPKVCNWKGGWQPCRKEAAFPTPEEVIKMFKEE